ncbi:hypothetical protein NDU88_002800 [Pleurodeles waltl]|uniref:Uncharacterized protein n=1 Tax=Pleurodeles waltl TaxID=8319 RepID=A0AAV7MSF9_PLEWA|nr:hypothetical protein NDU88_002800 [Pleurodeles waltl]
MKGEGNTQFEDETNMKVTMQMPPSGGALTAPPRASDLVFKSFPLTRRGTVDQHSTEACLSRPNPTPQLGKQHQEIGSSVEHSWCPLSPPGAATSCAFVPAEFQVRVDFFDDVSELVRDIDFYGINVHFLAYTGVSLNVMTRADFTKPRSDISNLPHIIIYSWRSIQPIACRGYFKWLSLPQIIEMLENLCCG